MIRIRKKGKADRGVLICCGSCTCVYVAANKNKGIYAELCHDFHSARQGGVHDNLNAVCLDAKIIGPALTPDLVQVLLGAEFSAEERHRWGFEKICSLE